MTFISIFRYLDDFFSQTKFKYSEVYDQIGPGALHSAFINSIDFAIGLGNQSPLLVHILPFAPLRVKYRTGSK